MNTKVIKILILILYLSKNIVRFYSSPLEMIIKYLIAFIPIVAYLLYIFKYNSINTNKKKCSIAIFLINEFVQLMWNSILYFNMRGLSFFNVIVYALVISIHLVLLDIKPNNN